ncbi:MAG: acyl carrier protein [Solirubrobacterales bacterium]
MSTTSIPSLSEIVRELAPIPVEGPIGDKRLVDDLGFDSIGLMELFVVIEHELGVSRLDESTLESIRSVDDLDLAISGLTARSES